MRWSGRTFEQWKSDSLQWRRCYALLPAQMDCGSWVWLEAYERRRQPFPNDRWEWVRRPLGSTQFEPRELCRPPTPSGHRRTQS